MCYPHLCSTLSIKKILSSPAALELNLLHCRHCGCHSPLAGSMTVIPCCCQRKRHLQKVRGTPDHEKCMWVFAAVCAAPSWRRILLVFPYAKISPLLWLAKADFVFKNDKNLSKQKFSFSLPHSWSPPPSDYPVTSVAYVPTRGKSLPNSSMSPKCNRQPAPPRNIPFQMNVLTENQNRGLVVQHILSWMMYGGERS